MAFWNNSRRFFMDTKTILCWVLIVIGIAGWSSLFAEDGFDIGSQHLGGIIQVWASVEKYNETYYSQPPIIPFSPPDTSYRTKFELSKIRLKLEGEIVPGHYGYYIEVDPWGYPRLVDAYIRWWVTRYVTLKIGRFHPAFTIYGPAPVDQLESPYYPLTTDKLGPGRQVGIQINRRSRFVQLHLGYFNGRNDSWVWGDDTENMDILAAANVALVDWADFSMQAIYGEHHIATGLNGEYLSTCLSLKMDWEMLLHLRMEWVQVQREVTFYPEYTIAHNLNSDGVLIHFGYNFTPAFEPFIRYEWLEESSVININPETIYYYWQERITLGMRYVLVPDKVTISGYYLHHNTQLYYGEGYYPGRWEALPGNSVNQQAILEMQLTF